ncbi:MAG: asparagine synthase (glutamine-hydrolyzing) [Alphaproteobacteria bacterium]|nr:asparagine synthase (glutamine-hydrolyzing) [Alphaproteobacteria bacterium]
MCGIAGILATGGNVEGNTVRAMGDAMTHRGPDDSGLFQEGRVALGFRRLALLDVTPAGNQPMMARDGAVVAVCNGEIYNHNELRRELRARGHQFRSRSDTEVVPHVYAEWGVDGLARLAGQFAFAVWDRNHQKLVLGRDPVGIAPLFYTKIAGNFVFASEIKALSRTPGWQPAVDLEGLDQILTFPGPYSPRTLFAGVHSVAPGHFLVVEADGETRLQRYWDLDYPAIETASPIRPLSDLADELDVALRQAVARRLDADLPVGLYLSGGLDSSLVAAIAADLVGPGKPLDTFSIVFSDRPDIDEQRFQRLMAQRIGSNHREIKMVAADILALLPEVIHHAETPLKESYDACSLALSRLVRANGLKAVLGGEGADELFGGYVGYQLAHLREADEEEDGESRMEAQMRRRLWGDETFFYEKNYRAFRETKAAFYSEAVAERMADFDCLRRPPVDRAMLAGRHPMHQRSYVDFKLRMADHLLADHGDRVGFANSVELRYPFLDIDVINCARRLPPTALLANGEEKAILKLVARRYLPAEIIDRRKFSFVAPGSPALVKSGLPWVERLLSPDTIRSQGYFNPDTVTRLRTAAEAPGFDINQTYEDDLLMVVLTFGLFLEAFNLPGVSEKTVSQSLPM